MFKSKFELGQTVNFKWHENTYAGLIIAIHCDDVYPPVYAIKTGGCELGLELNIAIYNRWVREQFNIIGNIKEYFYKPYFWFDECNIIDLVEDNEDRGGLKYL
jgi:hypothetical protein